MERTPVDPSSFSARKNAKGCPVMQKPAKTGPPGPGPAPPPRVRLKPTWEDHVSKPWWIEKSSASVWARKGSRQWSTGDLSSYEAVRCQACTIYDQLRSRSMPITKPADDLWLHDALETFRRWANQGFRVTASDPVMCKLVIPRPAEREAERFRVRQDIRDMSAGRVLRQVE